MTASARSYQGPRLVSAFIFLLSGVTAISLQEPLLLVIPFAWVVLPPVFKYTITQTEQLYWLLLISLPLSAELNLTPQLGIDFPDELLLMLLTALTLLKIIHQPKWFPFALLKHPLFMILAAWFFWLIITCIYAVEPLLSFKYLLAKTWYIVPFVVLPLVVLNTRERLGKMSAYLLVPMLFVVIVILIRHSTYGFSFASIRNIMGPFFRNHVNYSSMLVCLLPVAWCAWKLSPAESPHRKWILYGIIIGLAGLLFAYSRGAWIALLAGLAVIWLIRKNKMGFMVMLMVLGVTVSTIWLLTDKNYLRFAPNHDQTIFHTNFGEHMLATVEMKDVSTAERFYRWIAGARMLAEKPVTGFGPNSFYLHYRPYTVKRFETWVSNNPEHSTVHNYFILVALEQGVVGLVLFCFLYFGMLLHAQRLYHQLQSMFYKTVALATGSILVMIGVINCMSDMIETDKIGSLFWLCLGMIVLLDEKSREEQSLLAS